MESIEMKDDTENRGVHSIAADRNPHCRSIDWYSEGDSRVAEVGNLQILVRFIARNGRRARISISAPPGATFSQFEEK
jgi:hypothetical protein